MNKIDDNELLSEIQEFEIPVELANEIESLILNAYANSPKEVTLSYVLLPFTVSKEKTEELFQARNIDTKNLTDFKVKDWYMFTKILFAADNLTLNPILVDNQLHKFKTFYDYIAVNVIKEPVTITSIKINCYLTSGDDASVIRSIHVDTGETFKKDAIDLSAIYYVNDSSGDTHFFNDDLKLIKKVSPKKGRGIIFNPTILHAGQSPIDSSLRFFIYMRFAKNYSGDRISFYEQ
jgi:hypothetical protein